MTKPSSNLLHLMSLRSGGWTRGDVQEELDRDSPTLDKPGEQITMQAI